MPPMDADSLTIDEASAIIADWLEHHHEHERPMCDKQVRS